ncbi:MAG: TetR/AcrR family transcriptional regulator [Acidobacteria bacterium]|nr:TetR/AcrR family transcriptional regulator [Acidobacteriota bacterium]
MKSDGSLLSLALSRAAAAPAAETRLRILAHAADTASREGLEGLTIGRLATDLKMSKSGLIAHFGSKESLQLAAIEFASDLFVREVVVPVFDANRGEARLRAMLEQWLRYVERSVFSGGCFFMAASLEMDGRPGPVQQRLREATRWWFDALAQEVRFAVTAGEFRKDIDPGQLVFELHAAAQEANWGYQMFGEKRWFARARASIEERLAGARR